MEAVCWTVIAQKTHELLVSQSRLDYISNMSESFQSSAEKGDDVCEQLETITTLLVLEKLDTRIFLFLVVVGMSGDENI